MDPTGEFPFPRPPAVDLQLAKPAYTPVRVGLWALKFHQISIVEKSGLWAIVWGWLGDDIFSRFDRTLALHTIETTAPITTKFCTVAKTNKYSSWVVPTGVKQIQESRTVDFLKIENRPYLRNGLTDLRKFGTVTQIGPLNGTVS